MSQEQDRQFFDTFMLVLGLLVLFMFAMMILASSLASRVDKTEAVSAAMTEERIKPIGQVILVGDEEAAAQAAANQVADAQAALPLSGKEVYEQACFACHGAGVAGAPKFGDAPAWTARIAQGNDVLYSNAINGFTGEAGIMLAKGGNPNLSDDEVRAGVDYMVENSQ
ncbi:MAG: c-type cytochrome [Pseudomonadota bacterium]